MNAFTKEELATCDVITNHTIAIKMLDIVTTAGKGTHSQRVFCRDIGLDAMWQVVKTHNWAQTLQRERPNCTEEEIAADMFDDWQDLILFGELDEEIKPISSAVGMAINNELDKYEEG